MSNNAKSVIKYQKGNIVRVYLNLNKNTEPDLVEFMDKVDNKQGFLKKLIRDYINTNNK